MMVFFPRAPRAPGPLPPLPPRINLPPLPPPPKNTTCGFCPPAHSPQHPPPLPPPRPPRAGLPPPPPRRPPPPPPAILKNVKGDFCRAVISRRHAHRYRPARQFRANFVQLVPVVHRTRHFARCRPVHGSQILHHPQGIAGSRQDARLGRLRRRLPAARGHSLDRLHFLAPLVQAHFVLQRLDRKSTRLNSSHGYISYAVFCLKKKKTVLSSITADKPSVLSIIAAHPQLITAILYLYGDSAPL